MIYRIPLIAIAVLVSGCDNEPTATTATFVDSGQSYYGTLEPFADNAVYFVVTDRFVDGDPGNNQPEQGKPDRGTFDRPITDLEGRQGNIGYLGGDFRGILDNAGYIAEMGFGAVWLTPIVENPDEAFMGGQGLGEGFFADKGKTGYHGYWGVNFYRLDEHLVSPDLDFAGLTSGLDQHGLQTVLDIVCNHGSPSFSMPQDQPLFAELYDAQGNLVADHQNLAPEDLDPDNPLHQFFHREPDIAQLSNIDDRNPAALDYFAGAYLQWVEQGADAFRVDTIKHMPHQFWQQFATRIRAEHPGFFMFGESFEYNPQKVAEHTWVENGNISVLDFPGQAAANKVFAEGAGFEELAAQLYLDDGLYHNPYELMTFYDNHDMPRMDADETGFIDANNWLFTSRGIPVIYYGSEVAFRAGRPEHGGNRDYFGQDNVDLARDHIIRHRLARIGKLRQQSPALQRGLQVNLELRGDTAAFYRVYRHEGVAQTALVLLNKGDKAHDFVIERWLGEGNWSDAFGGERVTPSAGTLRLSVPPHDVRVLLREGIAADTELHAELQRLHANRERRRDR